MVYVLYRLAKNLRHVSPQNRFTFKEFETTTREILLTTFQGLQGVKQVDDREEKLQIK